MVKKWFLLVMHVESNMTNNHNVVVYRDVGLLLDEQIVDLWDGSGFTYFGKYYAAVYLRNSCGQRILLSESISVSN